MSWITCPYKEALQEGFKHSLKETFNQREVNSVTHTNIHFLILLMVATLKLMLHCRIRRLNPINTNVYPWTQSWPTSIHQPQSPPTLSSLQFIQLLYYLPLLYLPVEGIQEHPQQSWCATLIYANLDIKLFKWSFLGCTIWPLHGL